RIGRIVLSGGCAELPGLTDYLASAWGIPVETARPFDRIDPGAFADDVATAGASLAVAVGLALRRPGDKAQ
ncbi:MAG TPA: pilus assembly protein PilM, partial [Terriglobales bacterium]|nr:pilus assembly protein PilM [Terriglobales bacterium]